MANYGLEKLPLGALPYSSGNNFNTERSYKVHSGTVKVGDFVIFNDEPDGVPSITVAPDSTAFAGVIPHDTTYSQYEAGSHARVVIGSRSIMLPANEALTINAKVTAIKGSDDIWRVAPVGSSAPIGITEQSAAAKDDLVMVKLTSNLREGL